MAEVRDTVLSWGGRYQQVYGPREHSKSPAPLEVKDVRFTGEDGRDRRYVVGYNLEQAEKDRTDREAIVAALEDHLRQGDKSLVGNRGFRKYLKNAGKHFAIDREKVKQEARFDGQWVLQTNWLNGATSDVALRYKDLWMVEDIFRTTKSVLETRPIYHQRDETIRGHVFCSFLALVLRKELQDLLIRKGWTLEWADVLRDLDAFRITTLRASPDATETCELRSLPQGAAGKALAAAGVALGPSVRFVS